MRKILKKILIIKIMIIMITINFSFFNSYFVNAAINPEINYQGRLLNSSSNSVSDGDYNIQFKLYTVASGGSPIWTETHCYSPDNGANCNGSGTDQRAEVLNGLFSVMLGSINPLSSVDFNQTLYLSVNIGGAGTTPAYDGEMSPRKKLGTVPSAFESSKLNGISSDQFFRNDIINATNSATTSFVLSQAGSGKVAEFFGPSNTSLFTVQSNGNVGIGTSTPQNILNVYDNQFGWNLRYGSEPLVNRLGWYNGSNLQMWIDGNNTSNTSQIGFFSSRLDIGSNAISISNIQNVGIGTSTPYTKFSVSGDMALTGGLYDNSSTRGTNGYVLQTTGTGIQWVATSSLGISGGSVAGSNTQIQFNNSGSFGASSDFTFSTSAGLIGNDTGGSAVDLRWETDTKSHGLFVDASTNQVFVGFNSVPSAVSGEALNVNGTVEASGYYVTGFNQGSSLTVNSVGFYDNINYSSFNAFGMNIYTGADYFNATPNYLNFSGTSGSSGFGIRNNAGTIEYKNSGGSWTSFSSLTGNSLATTTSALIATIASVPNTAQIWTNMPVASIGAPTELFGATNGRIRMDLSNASRFRITVNQSVAGAVGATLRAQYSTDGINFSELESDLGTTTNLNIGTGTGMKTGNWDNVASNAQGDVTLRLVGWGGNGVLDPAFRQILIEFEEYTSSQWSTNGNNISFSGQVGIGTSTPQRKLHVFTSADEAPVRFQDTNGYCEINPTSTTWTCTSDERLKDNILDVASSTDDLYEKMRQLRPVTFEWKSDQTNTTRVGFIAQEVEQLFPDFVTTDKETGLKAVSYGSFIPYIVSFIQDLANKIDELANKIDEIALNSLASLTIGSREKPAGVTLYDEMTGDPYCMSVKNGNMVTKFGECGLNNQETGDSNDNLRTQNIKINKKIEFENEQDIKFDNVSSSSENILLEEELSQVNEENSIENKNYHSEQEIENKIDSEPEIENKIIVETNQSSGSVEIPLE